MNQSKLSVSAKYTLHIIYFFLRAYMFLICYYRFYGILPEVYEMNIVKCRDYVSHSFIHLQGAALITLMINLIENKLNHMPHGADIYVFTDDTEIPVIIYKYYFFLFTAPYGAVCKYTKPLSKGRFFYNVYCSFSIPVLTEKPCNYALIFLI